MRFSLSSSHALLEMKRDIQISSFSYPELRSSWPAPRIESSGKGQFCSPRFADFRSTAQPQGLENVERKWLADIFHEALNFWLAAFRCRPSSVERKAVRSS